VPGSVLILLQSGGADRARDGAAPRNSEEVDPSEVVDPGGWLLPRVLGRALPG